jgi:nucleotide-binding universal stress UspA family protein
MKVIVVGYDETLAADASQRALERAAQLAEAFGAKLVVTSVAPVEWYAARSGGPFVRTDDAGDARSELEHARSFLQARRLEAEYVPAAGQPADTIVDIAEKRNADLIVVGTREAGALQRLLRQSVSEEVAREARCDVLIVH